MIAKHDLSDLFYRSLAHWLREGAEGICCLEECGQEATHTFILYPSRDEYPLCKAHASSPGGFGGRVPSLGFLLNKVEPGLTVPTASAGDYHSWVGSPELPKGHRRGVTFIRPGTKRGEAWIEIGKDSGYMTLQFSLPPGQALLLLDILKSMEPELKAMAEEDHRLLTAYHDRADDRARRADAGGWLPIEE